jgi:hypothetical protein
MRASRLDSKNPTKKNSVFLWAEEMDHAVASLSLMKEHDINFTKKVRVIDANYDRTDYEFSRKLSDERTKDLKKYIEVKCFTHFDFFLKKVNEWKDFYEQFERMPKRSKEFEKDNELARWQTNMRIRKKKNNLTMKQISILSSIDEWQWEVDKFIVQYTEWVEFYKKYQRRPKIRFESEKKLAYWEISMRAAKVGKGSYKMTKEREEILSKTEGWDWLVDDKFIIKYNEWVKFIEENNRYPSCNSENDIELKIERWFRRVFQKYKNNNLSEEYVKIIESDDRFKLQKRTFEDHYKSWNEFCEKNKKQPSSYSEDIEERRIAAWETGTRAMLNGKAKMTISEEQKNIIVQNKWWRQSTDRFWINLKKWEDFVKQNGREPKASGREKSLNGWAYLLKKNIAEGKEYPKEKLDALNASPYWKW